jgi:guanylate kinase
MKRSKSKDTPPTGPQPGPLLVVLSGPSGTGKDAVLSRMKKTGYPAEFITTVTTRPKRPREKDGVDYEFISTGRFQEMLKNKQFLEYANVYGNWYGVPREPVSQALEQGQDVILKVDCQGAATIKKLAPQAVFIFVVPPSMEELAARLKGRRTESDFDCDLRLKTAEDEMKQLPLFDYVVVSQQGKIELAVAAIEAIITAEKHRVAPHEIYLPAD